MATLIVDGIGKNQRYESIEAALKFAKSGDAIIVTAQQAGGEKNAIEIPAGITLELQTNVTFQDNLTLNGSLMDGGCSLTFSGAKAVFTAGKGVEIGKVVARVAVDFVSVPTFAGEGSFYVTASVGGARITTVAVNGTAEVTLAGVAAAGFTKDKVTVAGGAKLVLAQVDFATTGYSYDNGVKTSLGVAAQDKAKAASTVGVTGDFAYSTATAANARDSFQVAGMTAYEFAGAADFEDANVAGTYLGVEVAKDGAITVAGDFTAGALTNAGSIELNGDTNTINKAFVNSGKFSADGATLFVQAVENSGMMSVSNAAFNNEVKNSGSLTVTGDSAFGKITNNKNATISLDGIVKFNGEINFFDGSTTQIAADSSIFVRSTFGQGGTGKFTLTGDGVTFFSEDVTIFKDRINAAGYDYSLVTISNAPFVLDGDNDAAFTERAVAANLATYTVKQNAYITDVKGIEFNKATVNESMLVIGKGFSFGADTVTKTAGTVGIKLDGGEFFVNNGLDLNANTDTLEFTSKGGTLKANVVYKDATAVEYGTILGNVTIGAQNITFAKNASVTGNVTGGADVAIGDGAVKDATGATVNGNVNATGTASVNTKASVIGNVGGTSVTVNQGGSVTGDIEVSSGVAGIYGSVTGSGKENTFAVAATDANGTIEIGQPIYDAKGNITGYEKGEITGDVNARKKFSLVAGSVSGTVYSNDSEIELNGTDNSIGKLVNADNKSIGKLVVTDGFALELDAADIDKGAVTDIVQIGNGDPEQSGAIVINGQKEKTVVLGAVGLDEVSLTFKGGDADITGITKIVNGGELAIDGATVDMNNIAVEGKASKIKLTNGAELNVAAALKLGTITDDAEQRGATFSMDADSKLSVTGVLNLAGMVMSNTDSADYDAMVEQLSAADAKLVAGITLYHDKNALTVSGDWQFGGVPTVISAEQNYYDKNNEVASGTKFAAKKFSFEVAEGGSVSGNVQFNSADKVYLTNNGTLSDLAVSTDPLGTADIYFANNGTVAKTDDDAAHTFALTSQQDLYLEGKDFNFTTLDVAGDLYLDGAELVLDNTVGGVNKVANVFAENNASFDFSNYGSAITVDGAFANVAFEYEDLLNTLTLSYAPDADASIKTLSITFDADEMFAAGTLGAVLVNNLGYDAESLFITVLESDGSGEILWEGDYTLGSVITIDDSVVGEGKFKLSLDGVNDLVSGNFLAGALDKKDEVYSFADKGVDFLEAPKDYNAEDYKLGMVFGGNYANTVAADATATFTGFDNAALKLYGASYNQKNAAAIFTVENSTVGTIYAGGLVDDKVASKDAAVETAKLTLKNVTADQVYAGGEGKKSIVEDSSIVIDGGSVGDIDAGNAVNASLSIKNYTEVFAGAITGFESVTISGGLELSGSIGMAEMTAFSADSISLVLGSAEGSAFIDSYVFGTDQSLADVAFTIDGGDAAPEYGSYSLIGNASALAADKTFTVAVGEESGLVTLDTNLVIGDNVYDLNVNEQGLLTLDVSANQPDVFVRFSGDFNKDGVADVAIWNQTKGDVTGLISAVAEDKSVSWASTDLGSVKASAILDTGDFNGDGKADLVFQLAADSEGKSEVRYVTDVLDGLSDEKIAAADLLGELTTGFDFEGAADFSGYGFDGAHISTMLNDPEIPSPTDSRVEGIAAWVRGPFGETDAGWLGAAVSTWDTGSTYVDSSTSYRFEVSGVADFNGDGKDDVLLTNTMPGKIDGQSVESSGDMYIFLTDGTGGDPNPENIHYVFCAPVDDWATVATGDFNGDGLSDVLLKRNSDNQLFSALSTGDFSAPDKAFNVKAAACALDSAMTLIGVGSVNGSATDSVLYSTAEGTFAWEMEDGVTKSTIKIA